MPTNTIKRVMCFGDSLTWGWIPTADGPPTTRYPFAQRWPGAMHAALGNTYDVIEEGLSGRTTTLDDPMDARLNGSAYLPAALATHMPLDIIIIMLGTNDLKACFNRSALQIADSMGQLLAQIARSAGGVGTIYAAPATLLVAPPPLGTMPHPWLQARFTDAHEKCAELARLYAALADFSKVEFLDAGDVITTDGIDGIHLTARNNEELGEAIATRVQAMIGPTDKA